MASLIFRDGACEEEDEDDGRGDPKRAVEIGVAIEDIKEVGARVEGDAATAQNFRSVDVKVLGIEGQTPKVAFGGERGGRGREGIGCVRRNLWGTRVVLECLVSCQLSSAGCRSKKMAQAL